MSACFPISQKNTNPTKIRCTMKAIKISIIIPVYQVEKYLSECIESVLSQNYKYIEIILIDDGSTDHSSTICDYYAKNYPNIKVIHKKNGGQSSARNVGMEIASGDYLMFLDSDDMLSEPSVLCHMVKRIIKNNADILVGNFCLYHDQKAGKVKHHHLKSGSYVHTFEFRFNAFYRFGHLAYLWGKLYRKEFLKQNHIIFKSYPLAEDKLFNLECFLGGAVYEFTDCPIILYRQRPESQTSLYHSDFISLWISLGKEYQKLLHRYHAPKEYLDILAFHYFWGAILLIKQELNHDKRKGTLNQSVKILKNYLSYPPISQIFHQLAKGKYLQDLPSLTWRLTMQGFSLLCTYKQKSFLKNNVLTKKEYHETKE